MATSEQIRNRIVELIKSKDFLLSDLLKVFSQLAHEGILTNPEIIKIIKHLHEDILQCETRKSHSEKINPQTGKKYSYNSHQFMKGEHFKLCNIEFITDND